LLKKCIRRTVSDFDWIAMDRQVKRRTRTNQIASHRGNTDPGGNPSHMDDTTAVHPHPRRRPVANSGNMMFVAAGLASAGPDTRWVFQAASDGSSARGGQRR
jgi:hypothetical protein